jgi:transposase
LTSDTLRWQASLVPTKLNVSAAAKSELQARLRCRSLPAEDVRRADIILRLTEGQPQRAVARELRCGINTVRLWRARFRTEGLAGLYGHHSGREAEAESPALEAKILDYTRRPPTDGSTHWSTRKLAAALGISHMRVARTWAKGGLQPHRMRRYMTSDDPDFQKKAADVIGLYLKPPTNAVVFCVDEKTAIQALDRLDPVLPLSPGRAERHGFEYFRHGTLSLYAALNTQTGEVVGKTTTRHTSAEFVAFLSQLVADHPHPREMHVIVDNLSAHKTERVQLFLQEHPQLKLHFTPTYSSWLNQVELWFSKIERDVIARGVFCSVKDLARKLMRYILQYNRQAKPVKWTYKNTRNRIRPESGSNVTVH